MSSHLGAGVASSPWRTFKAKSEQTDISVTAGDAVTLPAPDQRGGGEHQCLRGTCHLFDSEDEPLLVCKEPQTAYGAV